jgi:hypothetical protein
LYLAHHDFKKYIEFKIMVNGRRGREEGGKGGE